MGERLAAVVSDLGVGEGGWKWDEVGTELRGIEGVGIYMRD